MSPQELYKFIDSRDKNVEDVAVLLISLLRAALRTNTDLTSLRMAFGFYCEIAKMTGSLPEMHFPENDKEQARHDEVARKLLEEAGPWEL